MGVSRVYFYFAAPSQQLLYQQFLPLSHILVNDYCLQLIDYVSPHSSQAPETEISEFTYRLGEYSTIKFWLMHEYQTIMIGIDRDFFYVQELIEMVMEILNHLYDLFETPYGYGPTDITDFPVGWDADHPTVDTLYTYNFFGPELVSRIGRERLEAIDAWLTLRLDDGGIFLAMDFDPFKRFLRTSIDWFAGE